MKVDLLKKTIKKTIDKLESYDKNGEPLSSYEIGRLNAYDEILCFIELLEEQTLKK